MEPPYRLASDGARASQKNERVARDESKPMMPNFMVLLMSLGDLPGQVNDPKIGKIGTC